MVKPLSKVLVVVAVLIAFVGQALAYTSMSCEMSADAHQPHIAMDHSSMNAHEGMTHGAIKDSALSVEDCCEVDCICPANACASVTFLNSSHVPSDVVSCSEGVASQKSEHPKSISTSLFRPPIVA